MVTFAACFPFGPSTTSNSTSWPSLRDRKPVPCEAPGAVAASGMGSRMARPPGGPGVRTGPPRDLSAQQASPVGCRPECLLLLRGTGPRGDGDRRGPFARLHPTGREHRHETRGADRGLAGPMAGGHIEYVMILWASLLTGSPPDQSSASRIIPLDALLPDPDIPKHFQGMAQAATCMVVLTKN